TPRLLERQIVGQSLVVKHRLKWSIDLSRPGAGIENHRRLLVVHRCTCTVPEPERIQPFKQDTRVRCGGLGQQVVQRAYVLRAEPSRVVKISNGRERDAFLCAQSLDTPTCGL